MIKSITVTKPGQDPLTQGLYLPLAVPNGGLKVLPIDGLGPAKSNINIRENSGMSGSSFNSARTPSRNIVLAFEFYPTDKYPTIEAVRLMTYEYFQNEAVIILDIETDAGPRVDEHGRAATFFIDGYVESNSPNIFSKTQGCVVSIICPDPYFKKRGAISAPGQNQVDIPLFHFPFSCEVLLMLNTSFVLAWEETDTSQNPAMYRIGYSIYEDAAFGESQILYTPPTNNLTIGLPYVVRGTTGFAVLAYTTNMDTLDQYPQFICSSDFSINSLYEPQQNVHDFDLANNGNWGCGKSIAIHGDTIYVVYCPYDDPAGIKMAYSSDNGATWEEETIAIGLEPGSDYLIITGQDATILVSDAGVIHVTYTDLLGPLMYVKKENGLWTVPEMVNDQRDGNRNMQNMSDLKIDSSGTLHVVWDLENNSPSNANIYYSKNTGTGWSTPVALCLENNNAMNPSISIDSEDVVHISWIETYPNTYNGNFRAMYVTSEDFESPEVALYFSDGDVYSAVMFLLDTGPMFLCDAWSESLHNGQEGIYYTQRGEAGVWSEPVLLDPAGGYDYADYPSVG